MNGGDALFVGVISSAIKTTESRAKRYARHFGVPDTTEERQDFGGCNSNVFPAHLARFVKENEVSDKYKNGDVVALVGTKSCITYSNGQECVWNDRTKRTIYGKIIRKKYAPTSYIAWWELKVNPKSVKEVYYHGASMCLVIKLKNGKRIGLKSVSFMSPGPEGAICP